MSGASERAYLEIRGLILSGELPGGAQLREEVLADRCGVSRTPVRDALRKLESELLVTRSETQRSYVAEWSLDDVADAFELRGMLESHAARRAAERMDPATLAALERCNAQVDAAVHADPPDVDAFLEGNRAFHTLVLGAAQSSRLAAMLAAVVEQPVVTRTVRQYDSAALRRSHGEHVELLAAFARRDGAWAAAVMTAHIRRAYYAYADAHDGINGGIST